MEHCCKELEKHLLSGEIGLQFISHFREYGIIYLDGGTSIQLIRFCPWCGKRLPSSLRKIWFKKIQSIGLEPGDSKIPNYLLTSEWYQKK